MGNIICGIIVDSLPRSFDAEELDKKKLKTKFAKGKLKNLSPKDLSITFKEGKTLIFLDQIFMENISEESALTDLENDLNDIFPHSRILISAIHDTVDFIGFSYLENGVKRRTKAVVKGQLFLDYGELMPLEQEMLSELMGIVERNATIGRVVNKKIADKEGLIKDKYCLKVRDALFKNLGLGGDPFYLDGTSDVKIMEDLWSDLLGCDFAEPETYEWTIFQRRRLNFKRDSLRTYLSLMETNN